MGAPKRLRQNGGIPVRLSNLAATVVAVAGVAFAATPAAAVTAPQLAELPDAIVCTLTGSTTFTDADNSSRGINSTDPRDIKIVGRNSAACVDSRISKAETGGRTILGFTSDTTGSFTHSTCLVATGGIKTKVTWRLSSGDNLTSVIESNFFLANILEALPGTGEVDSGLFAGKTAETNSVFTGVGNDVKCQSDTGITDTTRQTTLTIAG